MNFLTQFAKSDVGVAIAFICTVTGLILTIWVLLRTKKINQILSHNRLAQNYNNQHVVFQRTLRGYRDSIVTDGIKTRQIVNSLLESTTQYYENYKTLEHVIWRFRIYFFIRQLKRPHESINWLKIENTLSQLIGKLALKEDFKNE